LAEIIKAIILGIVQGATEFIPVSSSGHLVIVPWLLGWPPSTLLFDAILHWGTLLAILLIFRRDFEIMIRAALRSLRERTLDAEARLAWLIVIGTIPAVVVGFLLEARIEALFASSSAPLVAGVSLLITAALLAGSEQLARRLKAPQDLPSMTQRDALTIGLAQVIALLPGVSRSGSTIAAGLTRNLRREAAARFSFLLGAPVFFGAGLLQLVNAFADDAIGMVDTIPTLLVGFLVSAITGFIAIRFLLAYLRTNSLYVFAAYCLLAGCIVIGLVWLGF
jgi:undecaprenyl-diphosphatase